MTTIGSRTTLTVTLVTLSLLGPLSVAGQQLRFDGEGQPILKLYRKFLRKMRGMGGERRPAETPREYRAALEERLSKVPEETGEFTAIFERVRYGGDYREEDLDRAKKLLADILSGIRR